MSPLRHLLAALPDLAAAALIYAVWLEPLRFGVEHRAIAGAVLYFGLMGLVRPLLSWGFAPRAGRPAAA